MVLRVTKFIIDEHQLTEHIVVHRSSSQKDMYPMDRNIFPNLLCHVFQSNNTCLPGIMAI